MFDLIAGALIVVSIYLAWMVWKKKTQIFHDQMEPKLAERRLRMMKVSLLVAGISFVVFLASTILTRTGYPLSEEEVELSFFIAVFSLMLLAVGTIGGVVIFLIGRRKTT